MRNRCSTHPGAILPEDVLPQLTGMSVSAGRAQWHHFAARRQAIEQALVAGDLAVNKNDLFGLIGR